MTQHLTFLTQTGEGSANKCVLVPHKAVVKSWKGWRDRGREGGKERRENVGSQREVLYLYEPGSKRGSGACLDKSSA